MLEVALSSSEQASVVEDSRAYVFHRPSVFFHLSVYCETVVDDVRSVMSASGDRCLWEGKDDIAVPQEPPVHL